MEPLVFITGSSRGIGAATARLAKARGMRVVLHGSKPSRPLRELEKELDTLAVTADITDPAAVQAAVKEAVDTYGHIDVLINCAARIQPTDLLESETSEWLELYNVNVIGTLNFIRAVAPAMQEQKAGRIVNLASVRGHAELTSPRVAAYSLTKAAIINLTDIAAKELAPLINVNAVSPGFTLTDMSSVWNEKSWAQARSNLLERPAEPQEIAEAILFLAGDGASHITGQTIQVDGGYALSNK